ncbi:hypothetical protein [Streptomyces cacaoi]|uniref:hypothetical protein n=1 Tax=Streptomyces cacaoi TaxID=1898 RepID=UPI00374A815B
MVHLDDKRSDRFLLEGLVRYDAVLGAVSWAGAADARGGGHPAFVEDLHPLHKVW